jgi:hypothetical protein
MEKQDTKSPQQEVVKEKERDPESDEYRVIAWIRRYVGLKTFLILVSLGLAGLAMMLLAFRGEQQSPTGFFFQELGKGLFLGALVSTGINFLVRRSAEDLRKAEEAWRRKQQKHQHNELKKVLGSLDKDVSNQTKQLVSSVGSLLALHKANVSQVYFNRTEAAVDIRAALEEELKKEAGSIRIIGISLNDFLRDENVILSAAWKSIERRIRSMPQSSEIGQEYGTVQETPRLEIRVLLIDPESNGAYLRAAAESTEDEDPARLNHDVHGAIEKLKGLVSCPDGSRMSRISFEARLYRTSPGQFLVRTSSCSFLQSYYFRPSHRANVNIPVLKFTSPPPEGKQTKSMHEELDFHFERIWDHSSVDLMEFADAHCHGVDPGIRQARIRNVYDDRSVSRRRIKHLILEKENTRIWIKGISLHSYFKQDSDLYEALCQVCENGDRKVKVLLISPECIQARIRSFREFLIESPDSTFEDFEKNEQHQDQRLLRDTKDSLRTISALRRDLDARNNGGADCFEAKQFDSAPEAFMLLTDSALIVEQYHYGQYSPASGHIGRQTILNKGVPLIEYAKGNGGGKSGDEELATPYRIFEDHFNFVFQHCSTNITDKQDKDA